MKIGYITNAPSQSGVGHRAVRIRELLAKQSSLEFSDLHFPEKLPFKAWPGVLGSKSVNWIRWGRRIKPKDIDVFDVTNQTLAFLAKRLTPTVLTVHDIIEVLEPQTPRGAILNKYLYSGIRSARHIIAVSKYTQNMLLKHYGVPKQRITVIPNGVGAEFYPFENMTETIGYQEIIRELKLSDSHPIILYVGSDHPRKNIPVALQAFAQLRKKRPDALFIKVGSPGILSGREQTMATIDELGIRDHVRFIGDISDEKLNLLYNIADALIFPSIYEGFGLPPLQAMAAGLPVVTSNVTSLPEVVGDAALTSNPDDVDAFVRNLGRLTEDRVLAAEYRRRGIARAKQFSWEKAAEDVWAVYRKMSQ